LWNLGNLAEDHVYKLVDDQQVSEASQVLDQNFVLILIKRKSGSIDVPKYREPQK